MSADTYKPQAKTALALARALELVESVPYRVSARWLFYRLLQEGYYGAKSDYKNKFLPAVSAARHAFYEGWAPDTLTDETRAAVVRGDGFDTPGEWVSALQQRITCTLDKWHAQDYYIELWFEARAMLDQFRHYTEHVTLRPLGGQPSIPYKWDTAKDLERASDRYDKPVVVLYFGDLDSAGGVIADVTRADVAKWCAVPFEFIHCGLTLDQVRLYGVPENPEKPGEFQWEALPDAAAREIIVSSSAPFISRGGLSDVLEREQRATAWLRAQLAALTPPAA